ncbi:hypothetical protein GCM10008967_28640 [Bacillus carboniphilus]|uniref:Lipoprotein n=1 Tax=Bacillus carboniphilus TaxID=86663 RepID=A0ABN0WGE9_9BACI
MEKFVLVISLCFILFGCSEEADLKSNSDKELLEANTEKDVPVTEIVIEPTELILHESAYLLDSVMSDITGDGKEEEVLLYISPSPFDEETGEAIWWEDLHLWQLVVKEGERTYPLFNNNSSGILSFWISQDPEKRIILVDESGTQLTVSELKYNEGVFQKDDLVDTGVTHERSSVEW